MTPNRFDHFIAIDWSGARGQFHRGIAIAVADADGGPPVLARRERGWSRAEVLALLREDLPPNTLVGLDLGISLPFCDCGAFFPGWKESPGDAKGLWRMIDGICGGEPHFAAQAFVDHARAQQYFRRHDAVHGTRQGSYFGCDGAAHGKGRFRVAELRQEEMGARPYSNFNLVGASQVGKSSLTGMRVLHALGGALPVWPIDPVPDSGSVVVEIYTAIAALAADRRSGASKIRSFADLAVALDRLGCPPVAGKGVIDDHSADSLLTAAWLRANADRAELWAPVGMTETIASTEGWTFGVA